MEAQAAAEMLEGKFAAYHRADWEHWLSCYAGEAQIFYNTASEPMSPREAAQMQAAFLAPLSAYLFEVEDTRIEVHVAPDGTVQATFYGLWLATFRATGATIEVPTHALYWLEDGRIVEEHGFWDSSAYTEAHRRATEAAG